MTKRRSRVWEFFERTTDSRACCNVCKNDISYRTTSNLKKHIERRHPVLLINEKDPLTNENETGVDERDNLITPSNEEQMENILIEYCDNTDLNEVKVNEASEWKMLRRNSTLQKSPETRCTKKQRTNELNSEFTNSADPQKELFEIEVEAAKQELELKKLQVIHAKNEEERRQQMHEINIKIKEAELQKIIRECV